jgi:malate dehydrogenase (oxaloacetate-decarboxylating)(NADP+)
MDKDFIAAALEYHRSPTRGKISVVPTKGLTNQRDLALAYSPAWPPPVTPSWPIRPTRRIHPRQPGGRGHQRHRGAGPGQHRPAGRQAGDGRQGLLFKKFAGIDVFDIELAENDPDKLIDMIAALEPTFGGINLEDIKAPECFYIEQKLRERMNIPVFHDDQHGTAIISAAAMLNGLKVVGKEIDEVKVVVSGAGAAAMACLDLLVRPRHREHLRVRLQGRDLRGPTRRWSRPRRYAQKTEFRTLADAMVGADVFLGLSAAGVLKPEMVKTMADKPLIFALANPTPEILPELAKEVRPTPSSPPAVRTTRTRSTTCCASPSSSAARWMRAPPRSPKR